MQIKIDSLNKEIKGNEILKDINLTLKDSTVYGLYGRNGSGKTMLMRSICGLIKPTSGSIKIDERVVGKDIDFPSSLGVIIETPGFFKYYTGAENLRMLASIKNEIGEDEIKEAMEKVGLEYSDRRTVGKYSLGMRQRLAIAQAIMESPDLIVLDEPTNALDDEGVELFRNIIMEEKKKGKLILIASHNKEDINLLADVRIKMTSGKAELVEE